MVFRFRNFRFGKRAVPTEIDPDEVLIDARNLPAFDTERFEGKLERPIKRRTFVFFTAIAVLAALFLIGKVWSLQVVNGTAYAERSEQNRLRHTLIFAERGRIIDRKGEMLAWNDIDEVGEVARRRYLAAPGLGLLLGYISYPLKDASGFYFQESLVGKDGIEAAYDETLGGKNGLKITETDAYGEVQSESVLEPPKHGEDLRLSVDARVQSAFYGFIEKLAREAGFKGGAGAVMDVETGELLAAVNFPEYRSQALSDGSDTSLIKSYQEDSRKPFLNRLLSGLYAPGSIVKLFIAVGALEEKIISPEREILSTGSISVQNPYAPAEKSVFLDWKAHGLVDMKRAIAVSSNVYFYEIGGGYENQKGLGIDNIEKYMRLFGFGAPVGISNMDEAEGVIPDPEWKQKNFGGEPWRLGDTYHTAIGQYGFQITPIQAVRAVAALGNGGHLVFPSFRLLPERTEERRALSVAPSNIAVVLGGMREAVLSGTGKGLDLPAVSVAGKTGTAEVGVSKKLVNSWVIGLFPYEKPRFAFAVIMEQGPRQNAVGGLFVMRELLSWMSIHTPEYLRPLETSY